MEITYEIIEEYNIYFNKIEEIYELNEDNLDIILKKFNEYLLNILFLNNNVYLRSILLERQLVDSINPINEIKKNLINIKKYVALLIKVKGDEIDDILKHKYSELICKGVFVIYQYYYLYIHSEKLKRNTIKRLKKRSNTIDNISRKSEIVIDRSEFELKIKEMLERNSNRFNNKLNEFIIKRIDEIDENDDKKDIYIKYLIKNINIIKYKLDDTSLDELTKNCIILYKIITIEFNKLIYNIHENKYITYPIDMSYIYKPDENRYITKSSDIRVIGYKNAIEVLKEGLERDSELIKELKKILITSLYTIIDSNHDLLQIRKDTYITLPQYEDICWFISMLTCLTFSDKNKELLEKKRIINIDNIRNIKELTRDTNSKTIFVSFIYYIIDTITKDFKTYTNLKDNCDIFKILKNMPIFFLSTLIDEYRYKIQLKIKEINENKNENDGSIFKSLMSMFISTPKKQKIYQTVEDYCDKEINNNNINITNFIYKKIIDDKKSMALKKCHYSIIKFFYNFLNINCLYIYKIGNKYYKIIDRQYSDYDVIIIDFTYIINNDEKIKKNVIKNTGELSDGFIEFMPDKNIKFNEDIYEIDFILHGSDNDLTCEDCGHCVSNIHYNGDEYYYNSLDNITKLQCNDVNINIPCSLIKQQWKNKIDTDLCYKLPKCKFLPEYIDLKIKPDIKTVIKNSSDTNICFNQQVNMRTCYVKKI